MVNYYLVRYRRVEAKIYRKTPSYPFYRLSYYTKGKRFVRSFKRLGDAKSNARRIVRQLHKGSDSPSLSLQAARDAVNALAKLTQLSQRLELASPLTIDAAIGEYVEAKAALGSRRLIEAVESYVSTTLQLKQVSVREAVDAFLRDRKARTVPSAPNARPKLNPKVYDEERRRLERFCGQFPNAALLDLRSAYFDLFFDESLKGLSPKTRNHYRGTFHLWLKWCVRNGYLPQDNGLDRSDRLFPDGKKQEPTETAEIEIYTPDELSLFLEKAEGPLRALIAIGAFAGLRTAELLRLEWSDVWRRPGYVEIGKGKAKTRQRRLVPITPALRQWIRPFKGNAEGRVWPHRETKFHKSLRRLAASTGIALRDNALRHGFITYRLALTGNEGQVAGEAGTSPAMIHRHYRELATREQANAWFAVRPPRGIPSPRKVGATAAVASPNVRAGHSRSGKLPRRFHKTSFAGTSSHMHSEV